MDPSILISHGPQTAAELIGEAARRGTSRFPIVNTEKVLDIRVAGREVGRVLLVMETENGADVDLDVT